MVQQAARRQVGRPGGNIVLDVYVLNQRIGELLDSALRGTGVTPAEYAIYSQLNLQALTPGELSERIGVPASTLSGQLAALRRRGHTSRVTQESDRRSHRLELTDDGREALEVCRPLFRRAVDRLARNLDVAVGEVRRTLAAVDLAAAKATTEPPGDR